MSLPIITAQSVPGRSGVALMARIRGQAAALLTQASLTSIGWTLTDLATGLVVTSGTFAVAAVVFDALQVQDGSWTKDSADSPGPDGAWGYNFRGIIPAANFTASGDRFQVDVAFTPATGEPFRVPFQFATVKVYG